MLAIWTDWTSQSQLDMSVVLGIILFIGIIIVVIAAASGADKAARERRRFKGTTIKSEYKVRHGALTLIIALIIGGLIGSAFGLTNEHYDRKRRNAAADFTAHTGLRPFDVVAEGTLKVWVEPGRCQAALVWQKHRGRYYYGFNAISVNNNGSFKSSNNVFGLEPASPAFVQRLRNICHNP